MKHELTQKKTVHGEMVHCPGCGKKAPREGALGLPKGWIGWSNPLFGRPWNVTACSMACKTQARFNSIIAWQRPCAVCGKPGHQPMDHAGWKPEDDQIA